MVTIRVVFIINKVQHTACFGAPLSGANPDRLLHLVWVGRGPYFDALWGRGRYLSDADLPAIREVIPSLSVIPKMYDMTYAGVSDADLVMMRLAADAD